ncbi:MAG: ribonuclease J, partial [bacterium]|nr:ribonuclease J [bacterium]
MPDQPKKQPHRYSPRPAGGHGARPGGKGRGARLRHGGPRPHQVHPPRAEIRPEIQKGRENYQNGNGEEKPIPQLESGNIRIIPLGGVEEIGRNMTAVEFGNDIIIIDCGFQFREDDTPGIDYILPNTKYLEDRREKVRAMFITHGHLDHIGGIPYIIDRIGYPPIYTRELTAVMIRKRQEEFPNLKPLDIHEVETEDTIRSGDFKVRFFSVYHTIPDSMGIVIETP